METAADKCLEHKIFFLGQLKLFQDTRSGDVPDDTYQVHNKYCVGTGSMYPVHNTGTDMVFVIRTQYMISTPLVPGIRTWYMLLVGK